MKPIRNKIQKHAYRGVYKGVYNLTHDQVNHQTLAHPDREIWHQLYKHTHSQIRFIIDLQIRQQIRQ